MTIRKWGGNAHRAARTRSILAVVVSWRRRGAREKQGSEGRRRGEREYGGIEGERREKNSSFAQRVSERRLSGKKTTTKKKKRDGVCRDLSWECQSQPANRIAADSKYM